MIKKIVLCMLMSMYLQCSTKESLSILKEVSEKGEVGSNIQYIIDGKILKIFNEKFSFVEFPLDKPFITVGVGKPEVKYKLAAFTFKDKYTLECKNQTIDSIEHIPPAIKISGILHGKDCFFKYDMILTAENSQSLNFFINVSDKKNKPNQSNL